MRPTPDFITTAATIGVIAAGVALFEVALIPGMVIGGAAALAPKYLPKLRRHLLPLLKSTARRQIKPAVPRPNPPDVKLPLAVPPRFAIKQAVAKTITFRIIVTTLDFTTNYLVIGELATAAGLSAFSLVVGPVFYLVHETGWNYWGPPVEGNGAWRTAVELPVLRRPQPGATAPQGDWEGYTISRPLAKTITFRAFATIMDFTTNYVVVGDLAMAVTLSAFGFVVGPFVYLGHEMAWDYYGSPNVPTLNPSTPTLLAPAPG